MKLRSLVALPLGTAISITVSSIWVSPAHAFLLSFTSSGTNSGDFVDFNLETGLNLKQLTELEPGQSSGSVTDFVYEDGSIGEIILSSEDVFELEVFPISAHLEQFIGPRPESFLNDVVGSSTLPDGFINDNEYVFEFDGVIQEAPSFITVPAGADVSARFTFGIGADRTLSSPDRGILDLSGEGFSDQSLGFSINIDVEEVPEPTAMLGLAVMGCAGIIRMSRRRQNSID